MSPETKQGRPLTPEELYEFLMAEKATGDWVETDALIRAANGGELPNFWKEIVDKVNREKQILTAKEVLQTRYGADYLKPGNRGRKDVIKLLKRSGTSLEQAVLKTQLDAALTKLDREQLVELFDLCGHPLQTDEK